MIVAGDRSARHRRLALVLAWLVATTLLVLCARTVDWSAAAETVAAARLPWIVAAIAANAMILPWWAAFWRALRPDGEARVSFSRMLEVVSTASALMNTVPFGGGHASSILLLIRRGGTTQRGALSVMALDQLGEGLAKVCLFLLVGLLVPLPPWMRAGVATASLVVGTWFVVLLVASRWAKELRILHRPRALRAMGFVLCMKVVEGCAIAAVQHAFGVDVTLSGTILVLASVILGSMIPVSPGNLGTYEASAFLAYRYLGVSPELAMSLALVQHACFMLPSIGAGYLYLSTQTVARNAIASR
jgi:uncharacterized membrane protein YbhN (UPF0104 family)